MTEKKESVHDHGKMLFSILSHRKIFVSKLALIQLNRPAILNRQVGLVCLPGQGYSIPAGKECYATGKYYLNMLNN